MNQVSGLHAVEALLRTSPQRVQLLLLQRGRRDERMTMLRTLAEARSVACELAPKSRLDRLAGRVHQGAVASCHPLRPISEREFEDRFEAWPAPKLFLVLDGVNDPRNLGACLRSAAAAGAQAVLLPKRRTAPLNAAALRAACGAAERLTLVQVSNLARRLQWLQRQGVWLVGAEADAQRLWTQVDLTRHTAIVLGSEGAGLRRLTRQTCDATAAIPMVGQENSLNVSVAAGVLLFEAVRQRLGQCANRPAGKR